jgi:hypothetical protein
MNYHFDHKVIEEMFWTYSSNSFQLSGGVFFFSIINRTKLHPKKLPSQYRFAKPLSLMMQIDGWLAVPSCTPTIYLAASSSPLA